MSKTELQEETLYLSDIKVNYKISGSGPLVFVLHGWGGSSDSWREVQKNLSLSGYRVICPDLPGFGKSSLPPASWGIKEYSHFVSQFIEKLRDGKKFFLLSHSFGGRIAIYFSSHNKQLIKKLVLVDSAGIGGNCSLKNRILFFLARVGNALFSENHLARFKEGVRNIFYFFLRRSSDYPSTKGVMREVFKKIISEDLTPYLSQISVKTLLVWGEKDKVVPLKYAYIFEKEVRDSKLVVIPKVGHSPHLEAPEELSKILIEFFHSSP